MSLKLTAGLNRTDARVTSNESLLLQMSTQISNICPKPDDVLTDFAEYVAGYQIKSSDDYNTVRLCRSGDVGNRVIGQWQVGVPGPVVAQRRCRVARFDAGRGLC